MPHEEAPRPARTLVLGSPSQPRPTTASTRPVSSPAVSAAKPAVPQTKRPEPDIAHVGRTMSAPAPMVTAVEPVLEPSGAALTPITTRTREASAASVVRTTQVVRPVASMHEELSKPLSELVPKRDSKNLKDTFRDLVSLGCSDVHMTRSELDSTFTIEARLDGVMQPVHTYNGVEAQTIATIIKTESKMSSDVNLVPEDGTYNLPIDGYPYRARAVALPLFDGGERITFRLPQTGPQRAIEELGFITPNLNAIQHLLSIPGGMTLIAGPTGEGKSTTALSSLKYLREKESGVFISLEDPVERVIPGIAQIEVKEEIEGARFRDFMKYIVRGDPNVLFIGEIREVETATAAVEIAKSGIRVLATIHASNNVSAMLRLMEMADATPLSVLESVNGVASQRLVRRLVPGTDRFAGRYPIHEVTKNSEELMDQLIANRSRADITRAAAPTSTTFKQNVDALVDAGITTREEARKVVRDV